MIRGEVISALNALDAAKGYPQKLAYALARGRLQLKAIAREIESREKDAYSPASTEYLRGRQEIGSRHAKLDDQGKPVTQGNGVALGDPAAYRANLAAYEREHAEAKTQMEAEDRAFRDWLSEEVTVTPWAIDAGLIPDDLTIEEAEVFLALLDVG